MLTTKKRKDVPQCDPQPSTSDATKDVPQCDPQPSTSDATKDVPQCDPQPSTSDAIGVRQVARLNATTPSSGSSGVTSGQSTTVSHTAKDMCSKVCVVCFVTTLGGGI